ncbi:hypothetical protein K435DRAFT_851017 [Dendrothele bispora CBS 962.96]|uniref:Uncharacterized protein n=1 Tax=Dendrothele bispora (strain CBS 962.96) TaxID=1314807 RepID=A0A4S8MN45_DENBC|nr:hypothetical protein K435DRAFT_851017 [Dendrothele bispora CBS 962.96]
MARLLTLVSLLFLSLSSTAVASSSCVAFDSSWNLYAFGFNGKDYNAGTMDTWSSGTPTEITASGRPPFDGTNTTCYLAQFFNAIYVMNADSSNPSNVYIYDVGGKSWSTQATTPGSFDLSDFDAILDHDTNVFYALSKGELFFLSFDGITTSAKSDAIPWTDVQKAPYPDGYQPVMALAQNHIHFLDVPGTAAGSADIFVIHFSFFQPDAQPYGDFPATHGQTTSIFLSESNQVQQEFAFIPDDGSKTYIINVESNTTQSLAGPTNKDAAATYFASDSAIVQFTSSGQLSYIPYKTGGDTSGSWTTIQKLTSVAPTSSGSGSGSSGSASGTSTARGGSSTGTGGSSGSNSTTSNGNGAMGVAERSVSVVFGMGGALILGTLAVLLC